MSLVGDASSTQATATAPAGRSGLRRNRSLLLSLAVLAAAASVAGVMLRGAEDNESGPLITDDDPAVDVAVGVPNLRLGQGFCYGSVIISNPSQRAATLESVRISGGSGLTVGTARVLGNQRSETNATAERCPTSAPVLKGYVIGPGAGTGKNDAGVELLLPIKIDRPGKHRLDGITVTYHVGDKSYRVEDVNDVVACTYDCEPQPGGR